MEWISVYEETPKEEALYLVFGNGDISIKAYDPHYDCWDTEDFDDYYTDLKGGLVTHWQPLPAPPK